MKLAPDKLDGKVEDLLSATLNKKPDKKIVLAPAVEFLITRLNFTEEAARRLLAG